MDKVGTLSIQRFGLLVSFLLFTFSKKQQPPPPPPQQQQQEQQQKL